MAIDPTRLVEDDRGKGVFFADDAGEEREGRLLGWDRINHQLIVLCTEPHVRRFNAAHCAMVSPCYAEEDERKAGR